MTRKDFLKHTATAGIGIPFLAALFGSCNQKAALFEDFNPNFDGKVIIVGAGAAGLTAGFILKQQNIDFEILEAATIYGGRVKKSDDLAEFPIDLGGEWIHTNPKVLARLLSAATDVNASVDTITYNPQTISVWKNGELKKRNIASNFYSEWKFKNTTWYDFFEQYMVPDIKDNIVLSTAVNAINYTDEKVILSTNQGISYEADKVLVTVPISILKDEYIDFQPALPADKIDALATVDFPEIIKIFIKFKERFYPDLVALNNVNSDDLIYDAAFGKGSSDHVLGLFSIGDLAQKYAGMDTEAEIMTDYMALLDEIFDGKASEHFETSVIQHWTKEPFIRGSYSHYTEGYNSTIRTLLEPLDNKVYFAGEALNEGGDTSTVHGASESAYKVLRNML